MANWSNPTLTSTYTNFVTETKDRDTDCATLFDGSTSTNLPNGTKRWNATSNKFEKWNGSAWSDLTATYAISISGNAATATSATSATSATTATTAGNVSGVVAAVNGGTGQSSYAVGDLLYASGATALSKLADVATGNALISGGVGVAPSWGKVGLTSHVSGTLPVANGGSGVTTSTGSGNLVLSASPTFTGAPLTTTPAADTNTTQIASTAFVVGQAGSATPLINGTAAVGTSLRYARQDHVHPTDTTRAPLASPAFTGTPTAPTPATSDNSTTLATTAYVKAQSAVSTFYSTDIAINTVHTIAHGKGSVAAIKSITYGIECVTAEAGYSAGDRVLDITYDGLNRAAHFAYDATNLYFITMANTVMVWNKSTRASVVTTAANWKFFAVVTT